jgi:hypothetical protein
MFVLCVLHSKDKRHSQDNQNKEVVQTNKKNPVGAWMFALYSKGQNQSQGSQDKV